MRQTDAVMGGSGLEVYRRAVAGLVPLRDEGDGGALCNAGHHTPPGSPILVARRTRALAASVRLVQTRVVRMNPVRTPPPTRSGLVTNGIVDRKSVVEGKSVSVRVDLGGRRIIKTKRTR